MYLHSKTCSKCKTEKSLFDFYKTSNACKSCYTERQKLWNTNNKEKRPINNRRHSLKKHYGLTESEHQLMVTKQNGTCAICNQEGLLCVDHNHTTGKVRGLLCKSCNLGIGSFADDVERLQAAINYLNSQKEKAQVTGLFGQIA